eukprot:205424-Pelagomonas_calceolata.AAC.5
MQTHQQTNAGNPEGGCPKCIGAPSCSPWRLKQLSGTAHCTLGGAPARGGSLLGLPTFSLVAARRVFIVSVAAGVVAHDSISVCVPTVCVCVLLCAARVVAHDSVKAHLAERTRLIKQDEAIEIEENAARLSTSHVYDLYDDYAAIMAWIDL